MAANISTGLPLIGETLPIIEAVEKATAPTRDLIARINEGFNLTVKMIVELRQSTQMNEKRVEELEHSLIANQCLIVECQEDVEKLELQIGGTSYPKALAVRSLTIPALRQTSDLSTFPDGVVSIIASFL